MLRQKLSLQERINALHEEIQRLVAARVDEIAKETPGVPKGSIEQMTFGRASIPGLWTDYTCVTHSLPTQVSCLSPLSPRGAVLRCTVRRL